MWEIDVVSIMKEDFIEKDKDCIKYGWFKLPKVATCSKWSIGSLLVSSFCERMNSCTNQVLTLGLLLGDAVMEKLVNWSFMVFMRKKYSQVADEQFEFASGILKAEDNLRRGERGWIESPFTSESSKSFIFTVTYLSVLPAHTTFIMTYVTHYCHTYICQIFDSKNVNLSNLQHFCIWKHVFEVNEPQGNLIQNSMKHAVRCATTSRKKKIAPDAAKF